MKTDDDEGGRTVERGLVERRPAYPGGGGGAVETSEYRHRRLVQFFVEQFARKNERQCVKVTLVQAQAGSRGTDIRTWGREERPEMFEGISNIETFASLALEQAQHEAQTRGTGRHRFEVRSEQYCHTVDRQSFYLIVEPEEEFAGLEHRTDVTGQVGQQMQHTEWAIRTMLGMVQTNTASWQQQIRYLSEQNQQLYEDRSRLVAQREAALAEQDERTMAMVLAERADDRKDAVLKKLLPLAPVALSRLLSKDGPAGSGAPALGPVLMEFVKTLTPDQINKLAATFSLEQRVLFMEALKIVQELEAAEKGQDKGPGQGPDRAPGPGKPGDAKNATATP